MLKMMGLVISMSLAAFAWGYYSDNLDDMSKEAQEKKEKDAIVVSVMPAGIVQGGIKTNQIAALFSPVHILLLKLIRVFTGLMVAILSKRGLMQRFS